MDLLFFFMFFLDVFFKDSTARDGTPSGSPGIHIGLKILTLLFIGGAAGTAQLLACERMDGTGWEPVETCGNGVLLPSFFADV